MPKYVNKLFDNMARRRPIFFLMWDGQKYYIFVFDNKFR